MTQKQVYLDGIPGSSFKRNRLGWLVPLTSSSSLPSFLPTQLPICVPTYFLLLSFFSFFSQILINLPGSGTSTIKRASERDTCQDCCAIKRRGCVTDGFLKPKYHSYIPHFVKKKSPFLFNVVETLLFMKQNLFLSDNNLLMSLERNQRR